MSDPIEEAARVASQALDGISEGAQHFDDYRVMVQALADAGMLATRKEYGIEFAGQITTIARLEMWEKVAAGEHPESRAVCRYVTEWVEVE